MTASTYIELLHFLSYRSSPPKPTFLDDSERHSKDDRQCDVKSKDKVEKPPDMNAATDELKLTLKNERGAVRVVIVPSARV